MMFGAVDLRHLELQNAENRSMVREDDFLSIVVDQFAIV